VGLPLKTGLVALMIMGACADGTGGGGGFRLALPKPAPKQITVSGKDVIIAGPAGFCVDPTVTQSKGSNAFVLLGSCAAISNSPRKPRPKIPAILTATVSETTDSAPIASSMEALTQFFNSETGRAALSRDGKADMVDVIETLGKDGVFYIHARDRSTDTLAGTGDEYWRALFDVKGRIVSASVFGLKQRPFSTTAGFDTLEAFTNQIKSKNAANPVRNNTGIPFLNRLFKKDPV